MRLKPHIGTLRGVPSEIMPSAGNSDPAFSTTEINNLDDVPRLLHEARINAGAHPFL